jgi:proline iminopeptidase
MVAAIREFNYFSLGKSLSMLLSLADRKLTYKKSGFGATTVVLISGGPGFTIDCLSIIHTLLPENEFTVISYNQSGTAANENAPFYKSIQRYAQELLEVLQVLGVEEVYLLGHSWGTAIVQEFLFQYPEAKIRGVIMVNPFSSGANLVNAIKTRAAELPEAFHERRKALSDKGDGDGLDGLIGEFWFSRFVCRLEQIPTDILSSLSNLHDTAMYYYFLGHDLMTLNGAIMQWNRSTELKQIKIPALVMSGEYDYSSRADIEAMARAIPKAEVWYEEGVSHFPMYEKPVEFQQSLISFLRKGI